MFGRMDVMVLLLLLVLEFTLAAGERDVGRVQKATLCLAAMEKLWWKSCW